MQEVMMVGALTFIVMFPVAGVVVLLLGSKTPPSSMIYPKGHK